MVRHFTQGDDNACNWGKEIGDTLTTDPKKVNCPRCLDFLKPNPLTGALEREASLVDVVCRFLYNGHTATSEFDGKHSVGGFCKACADNWLAGNGALLAAKANPAAEAVIMRWLEAMGLPQYRAWQQDTAALRAFGTRVVQLTLADKSRSPEHIVELVLKEQIL